MFCLLFVLEDAGARDVTGFLFQCIDSSTVLLMVFFRRICKPLVGDGKDVSGFSH
jgi:hypothetical protein